MQFKTLLKKDFILWRRNIVGSICEIVVPLVFVLLLVYLSSLADVTEIDSTKSEMIAFPTTSSLFTSYSDKIMKGLFKDCASVDNRKGGRVAIYPNKPFTNEIKPLFDTLAFETVFFDSKQEIEDLIDTSDYTTKLAGDKWNQLCLVIEFDEFENNKYSYKLRFNTTGQWETEDHWDTVKKEPYILYKKDSQTSYTKSRVFVKI